MIKVALYLRKSRDEETENRETVLERHEHQLKDYCKRNGLTIIETYREVVSGDTIEHRPQMQKLLNDVSNQLYDGVVCMEIERLSRGNQIDQLEILETFKYSGTKIYTLGKVYDLTREDLDEEYFEFSLFMSRREYKIIKRRLIRGKRQALKDGYYTASIPPFGFNKERQGRGFVLTPNEYAPVVKEIFERYASGEGIASIARYLNAKGVKPVLKSSFTYHTIRRILDNKAYIGYLYSRRENNYYKGKHEPIISNELFERVQQKFIDGSPRKQTNHKLKNPLSTIAKCGYCGHTLLLKNTRGVSYLRCGYYDCKFSSVQFSTVETELSTELKEELKDFNYFIDNYESELSQKKAQLNKELTALKKDIDKKNKMLTKACEMLELGIYSKDKFLERSAALEGDIALLNKRIEELNNTTINATSQRNAIPKIEKVLNNYDSLNPSEKNKLLKSIIKKIEIYKEKPYQKPLLKVFLKI